MQLSNLIRITFVLFVSNNKYSKRKNTGNVKSAAHMFEF